MFPRCAICSERKANACAPLSRRKSATRLFRTGRGILCGLNSRYIRCADFGAQLSAFTGTVRLECVFVMLSNGITPCRRFPLLR